MKKKYKIKKPRLKLFYKIIIVIIVSLCITNTITLAAASTVMKNIFIDAFTISNNKILEQIVVNFGGFNTKNVSTINAYRENVALKRYFTSNTEDNRELFKMFYNIKTYLKSVEAANEFPTFNISTLGMNGRTFMSSAEKQLLSAEELMNHPITKESNDFPYKLLYKYNPTGLTKYTEDRPCIIVAKQLIDPYTGVPFGNIYISIDERDFSKIYSNFTVEGNSILVLDKEGTIVSSTVKSLVGEKDRTLVERAKEAIQTKKDFINTGDRNNRGIMIAKYLPIYEMYLVNLVDIDVILTKFFNIQPLIVGICFLVTLIAVILVFFISRRITKPLSKLVSHMGKIKDGNFQEIGDIQGSFEAQEIQVVYNRMINEIDSYIGKLLKEQNQRRKAELEALQMQINPHFLYNTLATIKYLSWQGDKEAVTGTINALITLLQNTINKTSEMISIENEIENLKNYVTINQVRYGEAIEVIYNVEKECLKCNIPKLVLQPFIENAFFHAYQDKREGIIRVFITKKNEALICEIFDDGDGIGEEEQKGILNKVENREHFSGIGINNVNERIRLMYGENYGVKMSSKKGVGTSVTILIPYRE